MNLKNCVFAAIKTIRAKNNSRLFANALFVFKLANAVVAVSSGGLCHVFYFLVVRINPY